LTTRASSEDRRRATDLGADGYLVKVDFQESTLLDTVQRFLGAGP
jgi:CheY-like chemotaxis protein